MATNFTTVYDRFLKKITDDMYMELTPEDTIKDLQHMLIAVLPQFEFPRFDLYDYTIDIETIDEEDVTEDDFLIGIIWDDMSDGTDETPQAMVEHSYFTADLTPEEQEILAILMLNNWLQRQITSIENTRMKYSGSDFKMTSQANHLSKLLSLQTECQRQAHHYQRLYKRRRPADTGSYESNWDVFNTGVTR